MNGFVLTAEEMRNCDAFTIHKGTSALELMERVARCTVDYLLSHGAQFPTEHVCVLCGQGNNGGDGFAVARLLQEHIPQRTVVWYLGKTDGEGRPNPSGMSEECRIQYEQILQTDVPVYTKDQSVDLATVSTVVDSVFGIGLCRPVEGRLAQIFKAVNSSSVPVLAVDIPSGIHADNGQVLGVAIKADATVTVQAIKRGMLLNRGAVCAGRLCVCDVGIDLSSVTDQAVALTDCELVSRVMPPRHRNSHKGTYGRLLLACGSKGMAGAAVLSTSAALRCGVGLADVLTVDENRTALHTALPEAVVSPYTDKSDYDFHLARAMASCDAVVAGCGLGTSEISYHALSKLFDSLMDDGAFPLVLDADALNLLAIHPELWEASALKTAGDSVVVTPHPYEMARLLQCSVLDVLEDPVGVARQFAASRGVTTVLKGAYTVVASPKGKTWINLYGNAGMATGGSGDVLAGVIGALVTQNREKLRSGKLALHEIAAAGVTLHAMAADLAVQDVGEYGLCASDLVAALPRITRSFSDTRTQIEHIKRT